MGNFKKIIMAAILLYIAAFSLYSQTNNQTQESSVQITESSIILTDEADINGITDSQNFKGTSTVAVFIRMIIVLIIVVALIFFVLRFIKNKTNVIKTDDEYLRRAAYINIAPGKSVEVITLVDKGYLIGVTEDNITLLGEIQDKELIQAMNLSSDKKNNTKKATNFSEVLDMFLIKNKNHKNVFSDTETQVDNIFNKTINEDKIEDKEE